MQNDTEYKILSLKFSFQRWTEYQNKDFIKDAEQSHDEFHTHTHESEHKHEHKHLSSAVKKGC